MGPVVVCCEAWYERLDNTCRSGYGQVSFRLACTLLLTYS